MPGVSSFLRLTSHASFVTGIFGLDVHRPQREFSDPGLKSDQRANEPAPQNARFDQGRVRGFRLASVVITCTHACGCTHACVYTHRICSLACMLKVSLTRFDARIPGQRHSLMRLGHAAFGSDPTTRTVPQTCLAGTRGMPGLKSSSCGPYAGRSKELRAPFRVQMSSIRDHTGHPTGPAK